MIHSLKLIHEFEVPFSAGMCGACEMSKGVWISCIPDNFSDDHGNRNKILPSVLSRRAGL